MDTPLNNDINNNEIDKLKNIKNQNDTMCDNHNQIDILYNTTIEKMKIDITKKLKEINEYRILLTNVNNMFNDITKNLINQNLI